MTLRCPKCGSKRVIFQSMTDGTAVGSTDQRYLCKDCNYRGSFILESGEAPRKPIGFSKPLMVLDLVLFALVLLTLATGFLTHPLGLLIIFAWIVVFLITVILFSIDISQGSDEWYQYGVMLIVSILVAMVVGLILGFDIYGTALLFPFAVMGIFVMNWLFTDGSEEAIDQDLKRLRRELEVKD
jgi:DNA-directed RNA polymerase subunit RPC12/RpoP